MNNKILSIIIALCVMLPSGMHAIDRLKATTQDLPENKAVSIDLSLENQIGTNYTAFQLDVHVPNGYEIDAESIVPSSRLMEHNLSAAYHAEGFYRIVAYSASNTAIVGNSGSILTFHLVEKNVEAIASESEIVVNNIRFSCRNGEETQFDDLSITITKQVPTYKITYLIDGTEEYFSTFLEEGAEVTLPEEPKKEGHTFNGWEGVPEMMPAHDVTVNGSFTINTYTATFKIDSEIIETKSIVYNQPISAPETPEKEGHTFSGWDNLPELMPAHDIEVVGHYTANVYQLIYKIDGTIYKQYDVQYGAKITPEAALEKEGHTFAGWDEVPDTMPAHDVTVNGSFTINSYQIDYYLDGTFYTSQTVVYNEPITAPNVELTEPNQVFLGWEDLPERMPAHDLKIYGATYIDGINTMSTSSNFNIYDIQGKFVGNTSQQNILKQLKSGIYIIHHKKVRVK